MVTNGCVAIFVFYVKEIWPLNFRRSHDGFTYGFRRIVIPWIRIHVLLVPCWMLRVVASVSRLVTYIVHAVSEDHRLLLVVYTYPPVNSSQYYLPPSGNHSGDLACDCNSVMYKYEAQTSQRGTCANLLSLFSFYMACASCQGGGIYS